MRISYLLKVIILTIIVSSKIFVFSSSAATVEIGDETVNTSSSDVGNYDSISFTGSDPDSGILEHDTSVFYLTTISTANNGVGILEINSNSMLYLEGDIGSDTNMINYISFTHTLAAGLQAEGSIYANSIIKSSSGAASLFLRGNDSYIAASIGTATTSLDIINFYDSTATFLQDIYTEELYLSNHSGAILANSVNNIGTLTLNDSTTSLTINNGAQISISSSMSLDGTLNIGVLSTSSTDPVIAGGGNSGSIAAGTTINFDYADATDISISDSYEIMNGFSDLTVGTTTITDNSLLLVAGIDSSESGKLVLTNSLDSDVTSQLSSDDLSTLNLLLDNSAISDISTIQTTLFLMSSQSELENSLSSFQIDDNNMVQMSSFEISNQINDIIFTRLDSINLKNKNNINYTKNNSGLWGNFFGNRVEQDSIDDAAAYDFDSSGVIFGFDNVTKTRYRNFIFGGAISYANGSADSDSYGRQQTDITSYQLSLYSHIADFDGLGFYNMSSLNIAHNSYDSSRVISAGSYQQNANASYNGLQLGAKSSIGYNLGIGSNFIIAPNVGIQYSGLSLSNYSETNAGDVGLRVDHSYFDFINSDVSLKLVGNLSKNIELQMSGSWAHKFSAEGAKMTTAFLRDYDSELEVNGVDIVTDIYGFSTQLNIHAGKNNILSLAYNLKTGDSFTNNNASLQYVWQF